MKTINKNKVRKFVVILDGATGSGKNIIVEKVLKDCNVVFHNQGPAHHIFELNPGEILPGINILSEPFTVSELLDTCREVGQENVLIVRVLRQGFSFDTDLLSSYISYTQLYDLGLSDVGLDVIVNSGSVEDLCVKVDSVIIDSFKGVK